MGAYFSSKYIKQCKAVFSAALLLFCLIGTHWVGFSHSISHASFQGKTLAAPAVDNTANFTHTSDSCHLFDALTLAGFAASNEFQVGIDAAEFLPIVSAHTLVLNSAAFAPYQSRAPPFFIL